MLAAVKLSYAIAVLSVRTSDLALVIRVLSRGWSFHVVLLVKLRRSKCDFVIKTGQ